MPTVAQLDKGISVVRQVNFAAAGALNQDRIFTDDQSGDAFWTNSRDNWIFNLTNAIDPVAGLQYFYKTHRNGKEKKRWYSNMLLTTFTGETRPSFPQFLGKGQLQWVLQQTLGALTAQNLLVSLQHDL